MKTLNPVWNSRRPFDVFDDLDKVVHTLFKAPMNSSSPTKFVPPCDVEEFSEHFLMTFDLPGLKIEDINIEAQGNQLTVSGERTFKKDDHHYEWSRFERNYGNFSRTFTLPDHASLENIEAHYKDGVLEIAIPKAEVMKARKVEIKTERSGFLDQKEKH